MDLSVVIPVYDEEKNIEPLYRQLTSVLNKLGKSYEIIFIDDGSKDATFGKIRKLHEKDKRVKCIRFIKNFGQTAAFNAGLHRAKGNVIITMDGDLQNDPSDIPKLLSKMKEGYDVVSGWRFDRKDPIGKRIPSRFQNWLAKRWTGLNIHDLGCSLKAYSKESVSGIELFGEMHRYVAAIVAMNGYSVGEVKVKHHLRKFGRTKYGLKRLLKGFLDLAYIKFWSDYSTRPLHLFGLIGIALLAFGFILGLAKVVSDMITVGTTYVTPLILLSALCMILGIQFITFGFLGEIQVRTYYKTAKETNYKIKETLE